MTERPNLLLIMADQMSAPFLPMYGGGAVVSPHLDALAGRGVVFDRAYSNSPLCAPARFSMMSGQLNSKIGAYDNASEFPASVPTFAHYLRAGGYQTSLVGKMHFVGPDQLHGYEERLTTDIYPADFGWTPNWSDPDGRFDWWFHNMDSVVHAGVADVSNQLDYDDEVGFRAVRKLRDLARTSDDRPWHLTVSFTHPHDPYVTRQQFWDLYDDVPLPDTAATDVAVDPHSERLRHVITADSTDVSDEQIRAARRAYFGNISYVDHWVGELIATLERHGMSDNTMIVFTSDHGDMLGERGLWYKMSYFEHSARIPMVIAGPGVAAARRSTPTTLMDIAPTLLDLGGCELPEQLDGNSLLDYIDRDDADRTVIGEYMGEGAVAPVFMIRRGPWKYVWSRPDPPQLYDLDHDPAEHRNLAGDAEYTEVAAAFASEVEQRWDAEGIEADVVANQRARADIDRALRQGRYWAWDYQPVTDATEQYMRNHLDLNDVESSRRA